MEGALAGGGAGDARALEEEVDDADAAEAGAAAVVPHLEQLAEARRVVVAQRLRVAEGLEDRVGAEHARVQRVARRRRLPPVVAQRVGADEVLEDELGRLRLAGAALARDDDALVRLGAAQRRLGDREQVRRQRVERPRRVVRPRRLRREEALLPRERVERHEDRVARRRVDLLRREALLEGVEQRCVGEVAELEDVVRQRGLRHAVGDGR